MSNKKSRKLINIMLSAMMLLGATNSYGAPQNNTSNLTKNDNLSKVDTGSPTSYGKIDGGKIGNGSTTNSNYGKNGVAYVLLSSDFSNPGVYRYNKYDGSIRDSYISKNLDPKSPLFKINTINGKVSGLAANQKNDVYLLSAIEGAEFNDAPIGWLPTGIKFDENSSIYLAVAGPSDGGATDYWRSGYPSWHSWPTDGKPSTGQYWKRDQTYKGKTYEYAVNFGGPVGVKFLNGVDNTDGTGCPIWDGTYKPGSTSNAAAIRHPSDPQKVLLPSHVGALSYYLYGTKNESAIEGLPMDGTDGRDTYIFSQANGAGVFSGDSKHGYGTMFGCIVRRFYQKRENSLNLYSGNDTTTASNIPFDQTMTQTQANVLKTVDVKVKEAYGKLCGDNCIDGGEILGKPVETALSSVTVVTSTTGNRYGFNPLGVFKGSNSTDASLRVVKSNGTTQTIDIATDDEGTKFSNKITNTSYLMSKGITPASIKTIGVSSKFGSSGLDYIYGSGADYFVVQDSWWGKGGVAYEYYKGTDGNPGKVVKIDYVNKDNQTESEELGDLEGNIDAIAIDGDGFLYALKTEQSPADSTMEAISFDPNPTITEVGNDKLQVSYTEWRRDKQTTTANDETINDSYEVIPDGEEQPGDYKIATIVQNVFKTVKRYPQATGALGTEEDRGTMWAGHDEWINRLKKTSSGYTWDYPLWRQSEGTKASSLHGELAVVNVAQSPVSVDGTKKHYITVIDSQIDSNSGASYSLDQVIGEHDSIEFKVEGYKPKVKDVDGNIKEATFTSLGDLTISGGQKLNNVMLNTTPAFDGTYAHDEDGDTNKSGFPSSMFESEEYPMTVKWKIAQVEDTVAVPLSSAKRITEIEEIPGTGKYKSLNYQFKDPGRYIIQAVVTYHYFNFNALSADDRPEKLTFSTGSFTTEPKLVQVYANNLKLNNSDSYITNITLTPLTVSTNNNDGNGYGVSGSNKSGSDYDTVEGGEPNKDKDRKFGSLKIEFDAQFVWEEQSNTLGNLKTHPGIGVWDYKYYKKLYDEAYTKSKINLISPNVSESTKRIYNFNNAVTEDSDNIDGIYKKDVYNPGKPKATNNTEYSYAGGTQINEEPSNLDMSFIQWFLYLRPIKPQEHYSVDDGSGLFNRGELIDGGIFEQKDLVNVVDGSIRKYHVSKTIKDIDSKIDTPRDPNEYTFDLEIIYPRVTWLNNDLGANLDDGKEYYSSMIPHSAPIHVLSRLNISNSPNGIINQSYIKKDSNISDGSLFTNNPYFTLCVRDKKVPVFINSSDKDASIETTGDKLTDPVTFKYQISDNNPFLATEVVQKENTKKLDEKGALDNSSFLLQTIKTPNFDNSETNKKYEERSLDEGKYKAVITQSSDDDFHKNDNWEIIASYSVTVDNISPKEFGESNNLGKTPENNETIINNYNSLKMENWVGSLRYLIKGQYYDGLGTDSKNIVHKLYDNNAKDNPENYSGYTVNLDENSSIIPISSQVYLERYDNDPPSIMVELVSQNDNRRWVYQLIEGVNDPVSTGKNVKDLATSKLLINSYNLSNNTLLTTKSKLDIEGNTSYPKEIGVATVTTNIAISDEPDKVIPSFRRASRMLANVYIFDNCGYKNLSSSHITISNDGTNILDKDIKTDKSHKDSNGDLIDEYKNKPRGVFTVNLPMQVIDNQPQIKVTVSAADAQGNKRALIIPVKLVESTFETRVLETKEERFK